MAEFRARLRWSINSREVDTLINIEVGNTVAEATAWLTENMEADNCQVVEVYPA
jgi:hypothetical protein